MKRVILILLAILAIVSVTSASADEYGLDNYGDFGLTDLAGQYQYVVDQYGMPGQIAISLASD
jgi:hypothetical protein